ncbi:regulatory associated protein of mTOR [Entomortierella parvispora]|uniref:Regulatory associated protein of mTOR n=1 Tax=Entomortierella parvispora TaxID=205924 RepID=A0A9P3HHT7_9FUNG|nr:regulatory associated protein of mTOR [Entomortierella parvispora]
MRPRHNDNDNNEDARSTNSTLVNAAMNSSNGHDQDEDMDDQTGPEDGFRQQGEVLDGDDDEEELPFRHGFELDYDENGLPYYMFYTDKRHEVTTGHDAEITLREWDPLQDWRMREKLKTISVALVLCLNIGIDPPDVVKTNPCAKLEAWIDPFVLPVPKSLENIGKALQAQYEVWQPRARYKAALDPSMEDTKKLCCVLRRNAKEERILFHYNGHGVPKPTSSGEIWVFNKNYTQYIPVSLLDLQSWLGSPCIYVYDCSAAGNILLSFNRFAEKRDQEAAKQAGSQPGTNPPPPLRDCIQLAACGPDDSLPMNPDLPADIFTACLTTPIEIALRWFVLQHPLLHNVTVEMVTRIPGKLNDRRTPLGELNWIFTSITDTIAWNVLSRDLFKTLFRQDLMVAALFRNYLLADRIMRSQKCTPMSSPALPPTHQHPMWDSWDLALDMCLAQLPGLLQSEGSATPIEYLPSMFFTEQLMAFEVWLGHGSPSHDAPEQLAIVLQVLLSQVHRLRALLLLSQFLDLGPWAVNHALAVGISPYVLKLLQSPAADLKPVLVFIWARLLAVDRSFQNDLLKDSGFVYFVGILGVNAGMPLRNVSEHRAMCAFILATFCRDFPAGQQACLKQQVIQYCLTHIADSDHLLRQWACLCIGQLWKNHNDAKSVGLQTGAHDRLTQVLADPIPEVRAAAMWSLGAFISNLDQNEQVIHLQNNLAMSALVATTDASPIVRKELVIFLSSLVFDHLDVFVQVASDLISSEQKLSGGKHDFKAKDVDERHDKLGQQAVYAVIWKALLCLSVDSNRGVASAAAKLVDYVNFQLLSAPIAQTLTPVLQQHTLRGQSLSSSSMGSLQQSAVPPSTPEYSTSTLGKSTASKMANTLKRSASLAVTLKSLIPGYSSVSPNTADTTKASSTSASSLWSSQESAQLYDSRSSNGGSTGTTRTARSTAPRPRSVHGDAGYLQAQASPSYGQIQASPSSNGSAPLTTITTPDANQPGARPQVDSVFYDWCCEYFLEPQMKGVEGDEPGSVNYNERLWRRVRNEKIIYENQPHREHAGSSRWDTNYQSINNESPAMHLVMHSFEPQMVIADDKRNISVWNWKEGQLLNRFSNANPRGTSITSVKFINEDDVAMLLVASGEGVVKLYRKYDEPNHTDIVTSWRVLSDMAPSSKSTGTITDWQQGRGALLVGGDSKIIRVWDAAREFCISDIPTRSGAPVTSITSDQVSGNVFVAGFGDGAVRVYDRRQPQHQALTMVWKKHKSWIQNVRMQRGGFRELVSGSVDGIIKVWDVRQQESLRTIEVRDPISALDLHHHAPVIACASPSLQAIKVWNVNGEILSTVRSYTGLFGQKQARVTSLGFHPHEYVFGVGGDDGWISIQGWSGPSQGGDVHGPAGPLHSPMPHGAGHH